MADLSAACAASVPAGMKRSKSFPYFGRVITGVKSSNFALRDGTYVIVSTKSFSFLHFRQVLYRVGRCVFLSNQNEQKTEQYLFGFPGIV